MDVAAANINPLRTKDEVGEKCRKLFQDFLKDFRETGAAEPKYLDDAKNLIKPQRNTLNVKFSDVQDYNQNLATVITEEFYRMYPFLCQAVKNFTKDEAHVNLPEKELYVSFTDVPTRLKVRELSTTKVGTLIRISGQVVRTHPVHPELISGTFICSDCNNVIKDVEQQFKFSPPSICSNQLCGNRSRFVLDTPKSKFVDFQKVRIQETQAELPRGAVPRSLEVIVRAECVEATQAGDQTDFIGTLIVVPDVAALSAPGARAEYGSKHRMEGSDEIEGMQGLKALGVRELHYKIAFLACSIIPSNAKFSGREWILEDLSIESLRKQMNDDEWEKIFKMTSDKRIYSNLVSSLFPTIHGNEEIKKGLLLMLFGGVAKTTEEGTTLRGDINVCMVGDPSTAKSQFLKQISEFCPRAVYTSGKASSAAGLTAAVVKDEESSEFVIEAGALMLADNGVCCIDEFDKMDPKDQVAIHESMEQQTISITKAGIKATLNARTSILAAANPIGGRYNRARSLRQNIALGAPLISRFDLFFILVDDADEIVDYAIARKIVDLHSKLEESIDRVYSQDEILRYITFAKQFKPVISKEASSYLVDCYKQMRIRDAGTTSKSAWRITVRQLESLIRLSEALARLHCKDTVTKEHVQEAFGLLNKSIIRIDQPDVDLEPEEEEQQNSEDEPMNEESSQNNTLSDSLENPMSPYSISVDPQARKRKALRMSYDEYKKICNKIIAHMKEEEERLEKEGSVDDIGLRKSQLIDWYLNQVEQNIDSEEELMDNKEMVERVIDRLIAHDGIIISLVTSDWSSEQDSEQRDPLLVVHPNYILDEEQL